MLLTHSGIGLDHRRQSSQSKYSVMQMSQSQKLKKYFSDSGALSVVIPL